MMIYIRFFSYETHDVILRIFLPNAIFILNTAQLSMKNGEMDFPW